MCLEAPPLQRGFSSSCFHSGNIHHRHQSWCCGRPPSVHPASPGRLASRPQARPPATLKGPQCTVGTQMAGSGGVWAGLLTGSPPVPQLMRMVLHEALKALQMQGWDERWVPVLFTPVAGWSVSLQTERVCVSWLTSGLPGNWQPVRVLQWGWAGLCWS